MCIFCRSVWYLFLQNPVDSQETCQGPREANRQYQIRYQIGPFKVYESVNTTGCRAERCSHTYNLLNIDVPSSYDSVSVAAVNVVGMGPARLCTTQPISKLNSAMFSKFALLQNVAISGRSQTFQCIFDYVISFNALWHL